jgi:hypothetical protein
MDVKVLPTPQEVGVVNRALRPGLALNQRKLRIQTIFSLQYKISVLVIKLRKIGMAKYVACVKEIRKSCSI